MKHILALCLCFIGAMSYAQDGNVQNSNSFSEQFAKIVSVPNSPEAEAFTKYGDVGTNLFTGTPSISIPLYTIAGVEMSLPISLTYDASGIKVKQIASNVGLGWNLNVGGRVSRQTRGLPDHGVETPNLTDPNIRQKVMDYKVYDGTNATQVFDHPVFDEVRNNVLDYFTFLSDVSKSKVDIEQDYYSLNIMGLSETIWMNTSNYEPKPLSNPNLDIVSPTYPVTDPDYWEIRDPEGNTFIFGKDISGNTPYNVNTESNPIEEVKRINNLDTDNNGENFEVTYNSSWLISKIVSKNGKDVFHFKYTTHEEFANPESAELINQSTAHSAIDIGGGTPEYAGAGSYPLDNRISNVKSQYTQQFLQSIYHNGKEVVRFEFVNRDDVENPISQAIKGFKVSPDFGATTPIIIKDVQMDYSYFGDADNTSSHYVKRLKLDKVSVGLNDPENYYSFHYNTPNDVPSRLGNNFDTMGYINNSTNPTPFAEWSRDGSTIELPGADRSISPSASKTGTLSQIIYPTGGSTVFEYENHNNGAELYPGLRIKSIKNYTGHDVLASHKEYTYPVMVKNFTPILEVEQLSEASPCQDGSFNITPSTLHRYVMPPNTDSGPHISYSEVIEYLYENEQPTGYTKYQFKTGTGDWYTYDLPPFSKNYSSGNNVGSPLLTELYDEDDKKLQGTTNLYNDPLNSNPYYEDHAITVKQNPLKSNSFVKVIKNNGEVNLYTQGGASCGGISSAGLGIDGNVAQLDPGYCQNNGSEACFPTTGWASLELEPVSIYAYIGNLISVNKTEYLGTLSVSTDVTNEYNGSYLLSASNTSTDNGDEIRTEYTYVQDLANPTAAESQLLAENKKTTPIITKSKRIYGDGTTPTLLLSTQKTEYNLWTFGTESLSLPKNIQFEKAGNGTNLENRIIYHEYDETGKPIDASLAEGTHESYVWGYDGDYLVAKISNVPYANLDNNLVSEVHTKSSTGTESELLTALSNLRNDVNALGGLMTSYTYLPMVGVSTITDPRGNTVQYVYNNQNKLEYVLDSDDKVLSKNDYQYRTKETLTVGDISVIGQDVTLSGEHYVEFRVKPSDIIPSGLNYTYHWQTENGTIIPAENGNNTIKVYFTCGSLSGDSLTVSCTIGDQGDQYYPIKISALKKPDLCILTGNITATEKTAANGDTYIEFKLENVNGGNGGPYITNWNLKSYQSGLEISSPDANTFHVTYECDQMLDFIKVDCHVDDGAGTSALFLKEAAPCEIEMDPLNAISIDAHDEIYDILTFKANTIGGHPDGFLYYNWQIVSATPADAVETIVFDGVPLPYNDNQGKFYIKYKCDSNQNISLTLRVTTAHLNGTGVTSNDISFDNIGNTCTPQ